MLKGERPIKRLDTYSDKEIVDFVLESRHKNSFDPLILELARRLQELSDEIIWKGPGNKHTTKNTDTQKYKTAEYPILESKNK